MWILSTSYNCPIQRALLEVKTPLKFCREFWTLRDVLGVSEETKIDYLVG